MESLMNKNGMMLKESKLKIFCDECKENSKKIVLATGVFDILHPGHLKFLEKSREYGDVLIVGINDDNFARGKGVNRPIQNENDRAYLMSGFKCVNYVHIFDRGNRGMDLIRLVQPDVFIMSTTSQDKPKDRTELFELMSELGGRVVVFDAFHPSHSTDIIDKIIINKNEKNTR